MLYISIGNEDIHSDFILGEDDTGTIVAKSIKLKEHNFYEEDGIIYHKNYNKKVLTL